MESNRMVLDYAGRKPRLPPWWRVVTALAVIVVLLAGNYYLGTYDVKEHYDGFGVPRVSGADYNYGPFLTYLVVDHRVAPPPETWTYRVQWGNAAILAAASLASVITAVVAVRRLLR